MNFVEAIQTGDKVRRAVWPANMSVRLEHSDKHVDMKTMQLVPAPYSAVLKKFEGDVWREVLHILNLVDVLASDWEKYVAPVVAAVLPLVAPAIVAAEPQAAPVVGVVSVVVDATEVPHGG